MVCCSLGKATFPAPSLAQLLIVPGVEMRSQGPFSTQFDVSIGVIANLMLGQSCWWHFTGVASDVSRRRSLTANSLFIWLFKSFAPSSAMFSESWLWRSVHWDWAPQLCILTGCDFLQWFLCVTSSHDWVLLLTVCLLASIVCPHLNVYISLEFLSGFKSEWRVLSSPFLVAANRHSSYFLSSFRAAPLLSPQILISQREFKYNKEGRKGNIHLM